MAWAYKAVYSTNQEASHGDIQNELNKLTKMQMASAKVCATVNQNSGESYRYVGIVLYDASLEKLPDPTTLTTTWKQVGFAVTNNPNTNNMEIWQSVVDYINNPENGITDAQAFYSVVSMDHSGDYQNYMDTNVVIWYRNSTGNVAS